MQQTTLDSIKFYSLILLVVFLVFGTLFSIMAQK